MVLVDHKTFPGSVDEARFKALAHAGQLEAYATALAQATGAPVLERWFHLPVSDLAMRLEESWTRAWPPPRAPASFPGISRET